MGGNREFWTRALIEQNYRWLFAYFLAATGHPQRAEDLTQEVFVAALESAARFDPSRSLAAWLRGIARHTLLASYRDAKRAPLVHGEAVLDHLERAAAGVQAAHEMPEHADSRLAALRDCLEKLSDRGRQVLGLKYGAGQRSRTIAETIGMTVAAVDMLLSRARATLEECIGRKLRAASEG